MPKFKLVFKTNYYDEFGICGKGMGVDIESETPFSRVIVAKSLEEAQVIGEAMLGEQTNYNESISKLVSVTPTKKRPYLASWDEHQTWKNVLNNLGLKEDDVEFIYDRSKSKKEKVGIKIKKEKG